MFQEVLAATCVDLSREATLVGGRSRELRLRNRWMRLDEQDRTGRIVVSPSSSTSTVLITSGLHNLPGGCLQREGGSRKADQVGSWAINFRASTCLNPRKSSRNTFRKRLARTGRGRLVKRPTHYQ